MKYLRLIAILLLLALSAMVLMACDGNKPTDTTPSDTTAEGNEQTTEASTDAPATKVNVTLTIKDQDGNPMAEAVITILPADETGESATLTADDQGTVTVSLPEGEYTLMVNFKMAPERREELAAIIIREFEKLAAEGPVTEHVEKVRSYMLKSFEESQKKNGAWMNWLYNFYFENEDNHTGYEELVKSITTEDIRLLAKYILDQGNFIEVSMTPAE